MFIGLNPSFSERGFRTILADTPYDYIVPAEFLHWRNKSKFDVATAAAIERIAKDKHPYFAKFKDISEYVRVAWEHIDLFFYRATSQRNFKPVVMDGDELNNIGREQLKMAKSLVVAVRPQMIVVANAFAAGIFQAEFKADFDEAMGCLCCFRRNWRNASCELVYYRRFIS